MGPGTAAISGSPAPSSSTKTRFVTAMQCCSKANDRTSHHPLFRMRRRSTKTTLMRIWGRLVSQFAPRLHSISNRSKMHWRIKLVLRKAKSSSSMSSLGKQRKTNAFRSSLHCSSTCHRSCHFGWRQQMKAERSRGPKISDWTATTLKSRKCLSSISAWNQSRFQRSTCSVPCQSASSTLRSLSATKSVRSWTRRVRT